MLNRFDLITDILNFFSSNPLRIVFFYNDIISLKTNLIPSITVTHLQPTVQMSDIHLPTFFNIKI